MAVRRVAVIGGTPMWRRGVASVLDDAGYRPVEYPTLDAWMPGRGGAAVIFHLADARGLDGVETFCGVYPHIPLVAVTPVLGVAEFAAAIRAGASSALAEDEPTEVLVATLEHAMAGRCSAPPVVMRALAVRVAAGFGEMLSIDDTDRQRLRALAAGATVARLADEAGFSEREMFRMLGDLYRAIGVKSRTEAIIWASRHGVLDDEAATHL